MMPRMRGMNPKQMEKMMKRMGMTELDAEKVTIRLKDGNKIVIKSPSIQVIEMQGQKTYTITGTDKKVRSKKGKVEIDDGDEQIDEDMGTEQTLDDGIEEETAVPKYTDEDVKLVAGQANVSEEEARKALDECDGAPAEAIIKLMGG